MLAKVEKLVKITSIMRIPTFLIPITSMVVDSINLFQTNFIDDSHQPCVALLIANQYEICTFTIYRIAQFVVLLYLIYFYKKQS